jgi:hypothetical protein
VKTPHQASPAKTKPADPAKSKPVKMTKPVKTREPVKMTKLATSR